MTRPDSQDNAVQDDSSAVTVQTSESMSLNAQIRRLLFDCPSKQAFFERVLTICQEQFPATVARIDFRAGHAVQSHLSHDPRMAKSLADRFNSDYLKPFSEEVQSASNVEPKLKRFERGDQKMTLIAAPIMDPANDQTEGAVVLMLGGGTYKADVVLPRLDGIVAVAAAVLVAKMGVFSKTTSSARSTADSAASSAAVNGTLMENIALSKASQFGSTKEFGYSIVNSLCGQLQAEQVFFGVEQNHRIIVEAVSGFPDFKASSPGIAIVRQAMEECLDHGAMTVAQHALPEGMSSLAIHRQWSADSRNSCVCSIPLRKGKEITSVISFRRPASRPFRSEELATLEQTLAPYGAATRVVEKASRTVATQLKIAVGDSAKKNLGKGAIGRKVALASLLVAFAWFLFGTLIYRPLCQTRVTAADLRHYSAPFDGKLKSVHVRPGQSVVAGEVLVEFDTADLQLQLNSFVRQISSDQVKVRQAISDEDLSLAALARSQINVLQAQAAAIQKQIQDARIVAPSDGTVVLSDLEQRVGQVFSHGEEILQFAAEGDWLLEIEVPDDIVNFVAADQTGTFAAASSPTEKQPFRIRHIDGSASVVNDRNVFIARAPLEAHPSWMKTGMEGTSRVETVSRPVWWVAMHRVVDWARTNFWL